MNLQRGKQSHRSDTPSICPCRTELVEWKIVAFIYIPGAMMFHRVTPIDDGVSHSFVGIIDADLGSKTPSSTFL